MAVGAATRPRGRQALVVAVAARSSDPTAAGDSRSPLAAALAMLTAAAWTLGGSDMAHADAPTSAVNTEPPTPAATASSSSSSSPAPLLDGRPLSKEHLRLARRFTRRNQQKYHRYVIVGSGTAAHAAIEAIRQAEPDADILILSDERALPRLESSPRRGRPTRQEEPDESDDEDEPMAEALLETYNEWRRHIAQRLEDEPAPSWSSSSSSVSTGPVTTTSSPSPSPVTLLLPRHTTLHFDVEKNRIALSDGTEIRYEKCLIASSGRPRHFYVLDSDRISFALKDRINTATTYGDFAQLNALGSRPEIQRIAVVGGGFLGTEVAAALATDPRNAHLRTQLLFVEAAPARRSLPGYLADELARRLTRAGVEVTPHRLVTSVKGNDQEPTTTKATGDNGDNAGGVTITALGDHARHRLRADYVVLAATHTEPNLRLDRRHSSFELDERNGGIVVNAQLEAMAGVFVAGNAASYYDPYVGRRRVDRYDHAVNSGLVAGMNMVAAATPTPGHRMKLYRHQPLFRSRLAGLDVQIEGIGEIDSSLHTVGIWVQQPEDDGHGDNHHDKGGDVAGSRAPTYERGVVYYLQGNKVLGILLWNASDVLDSARQLLLARPELHDHVVEELKEAISLGPEDWLRVIIT